MNLQNNNNIPNTKLVTVGKIVGAHGIRGDIKAIPLSNIPGRLNTVENVIIEYPNGRNISCVVEASRNITSAVIMKITGVDNREDAETLKGAYISINQSDAPQLKKNTFYDYELIGLSVIDKTGSVIGTIIRIDSFPANDVLVIDGTNGLIQLPAIKEFVLSVDTDLRQITVDVPDGMADLYGKK